MGFHCLTLCTTAVVAALPEERLGKLFKEVSLVAEIELENVQPVGADVLRASSLNPISRLFLRPSFYYLCNLGNARPAPCDIPPLTVVA